MAAATCHMTTLRVVQSHRVTLDCNRSCRASTSLGARRGAVSTRLRATGVDRSSRSSAKFAISAVVDAAVSTSQADSDLPAESLSMYFKFSLQDYLVSRSVVLDTRNSSDTTEGNAEGSLNESAISKVTMALEGTEGVSQVRVYVDEGAATVELVKQTNIQATGVASSLVEIIEQAGFKMQALSLGFDDDDTEDDEYIDYDASTDTEETLEPNYARGARALMAESSCRTEDLKQSEEDFFFVRCDGERVLTSSDEELLDEQDRITGALQIGLVGCRRSASWICFGGGARTRRKRAWKTVNRKGSIAKARKLVDIISELPSAKEEIYGALDAFIAWELEFPIIAIKKALQLMAEDQQWKRVIQVTKWMLSKGQGKTLGTYTVLLQALDYEGRVEEADALWEKLLTLHEDATPRIMFTVVIAMFERHNQPRRLLQVFADMEELEIKPDRVTVERVARTYRSLGLLKRADAVEAKYPPTTWGIRYSKRGKKYRIRVTAEGNVIKPENAISSEAQAAAEVEEEDAEDSDSDNDDEYFYKEESVGEKSYLLNSDNVFPSP